MSDHPVRPALVELRLTAFKSYRGAAIRLAPVTILHGPSGAGRSNLLEALAVLSALAEGESIAEALSERPDSPRGGAAGCAPYGSSRFALGCTVAAGGRLLALDIEVSTAGPVRLLSERLWRPDTGEVLVETGEEDAKRGRINTAWPCGGRRGTTRLPLSSASSVTAQLPLKIGGLTDSELAVLTAAEQVLTPLREIFPVAPVPERMRRPAPPGPYPDRARLRSDAANLSAVLPRIKAQCPIRAARLVRAMDPLSPAGRVEDLYVESVDGGLLAGLDEGPYGRTGLDRLPTGSLRFIAFAAVLLTGADVLEMAPAEEVLGARRQLTVSAYDLDAGLGREQAAKLLDLATEMTARGQTRLVATLQDREVARGSDPGSVSLVGCRRVPETGLSVLVPHPRAGTASGTGTGGGAGSGSAGAMR
jgi:energy-coupling factor transporter ATP-binding protein EcfA2